jgi:acetoacetyl-CoA reductase
MTDNQRVALVTGGCGGIGSAICQRLVTDGFTVVTNYRSEEKALKWQQQMREQGVDFAIYEGDVSDFDQCQQMISAIEKDFGRIDVIVNNAGITRDTTMRKMEKAQWDDVVWVYQSTGTGSCLQGDYRQYRLARVYRH